MRKTIAAILLTLSLFVCSCTITKQIAYTQVSTPDVNYIIDTDCINFSVEIDYIKSDDIAKQMSQLLYSNFSNFNQTKASWPKSMKKVPVTVEVKVTQRSFMKDINQYNSIFVVYNIFDEEGNIIMQNCINRESKDTIISCIEQNKISKIITDNVTKYLSQNVERKNLKKSAEGNED